MTTTLRTVAFLALSSLAFAGCADNGEPTDDVADDDSSGKADSTAAKPSGHYVLDFSAAKEAQLTDLQLNADKSFARIIFTYCTAAPGSNIAYPIDCGHEAGTYKFTKSTTSSTRYVRFVNDQGNLMDRYAYKVNADSSLSLRRDDETAWFTMQPQEFAPR